MILEIYGLHAFGKSLSAGLRLVGFILGVLDQNMLHILLAV